MRTDRHTRRSTAPFALAALTVLRFLFQEVPTRAAEAFLLLPVSRRRVAAAVLARSLAAPRAGQGLPWKRRFL